MRLHHNLVWDTCSIIALLKDGLEPLLSGQAVLAVQTRQLRYVDPSVLRSVLWIQCRGPGVDTALVNLSVRGYVVITLDRGLMRRIRCRGGMVIHYKDVRDHLLGYGYHRWIS